MHRGDVSKLRDTISTCGKFSTWEDIMINMQKLNDKGHSIYVENEDVLNIP